MTDSRESKAETTAPEMWVPALKEASVAFVAAALLLSILYVIAFRWIHPEFVPFMDREATTLIVPGKNLIPVSVGAYRVEGDSAIIDDFNGDEAILALPRAFRAEDYPFIKVNLEGFTRYSKLKILWRRVEEPSITHALEFNRSGDEATQIAMAYGDENYKGRIADIALLFFDGPALGIKNNNDVDISIHSIEFRPFSAFRVSEQIFEDWVNPPLWKGYSNNIVRGIHHNGVLPPNAVSQLIVLTGILIHLIFRRLVFFKPEKGQICSVALPVLILCIYSWALTDLLRWQWRIEQAIDSYERYSGKTMDEKVHSSPIRCQRFPSDCRSELLPYL